MMTSKLIEERILVDEMKEIIANIGDIDLISRIQKSSNHEDENIM
ncbi:hypothetical protein [Ilyobacter polytropus]|jgi:hypothetical protein|nr:hypothetical protein [Ilyobacter polytropus]